MFVNQPLLFNGVMITPADVSAANVVGNFKEDPEFPFILQCDLDTGGVGHDRIRRTINIPCRSMEEGKSTIRQIYEVKNAKYLAQTGQQQLLKLLEAAARKYLKEELEA